jgi:hypothetical protein
LLKIAVVVTEEEVVLDSAGESLLLREAREALEAQALAGINRDGQPIVGAGGRRLDLHDTGRLWQDVTEAPAQGALIFNAPYAETVLKKYKADALAPASQEGLTRKLEPLLDPHLTNQETR